MNHFIKRKERIIFTAIDIVSDLGFQGLSTKEIAKRQGISEGTLYKHFKSKNEIILGVLDYYSKFDKSIEESIELNKLRPKESITFFIKMVAEYYENYPAITAITNLQETLEHESSIAERNKEIFENRVKLIIQYIEDGKKNGEFRSDIDSETIAIIISGSFREIILKWRLNKFNFPLKERILFTLNMILTAF
ncbi:TetR/AcrR family transcriptional regulator [Clostridium sp. JS66]|uniref:TetR/AcrR family transcriptional regulator n=1 Tax=Clostridium sp. JS66 TaxID=3064705 RepID=UPI00298E6EEF|nr:TetR/AcrR family transcriptional regulator [Clostridium sp. JS66]WPC44198.1 TetR/AcrR family transcriptional regulator [Clostridium sp. JS66]